MSTEPNASAEAGIEAARAKLGDIVNRAEYAGEITYLTRNGRRVAAVVPLAAIRRGAAGGVGEAGRRPCASCGGDHWTRDHDDAMTVERAYEAADHD